MHEYIIYACKLEVNIERKCYQSTKTMGMIITLKHNIYIPSLMSEKVSEVSEVSEDFPHREIGSLLFKERGHKHKVK